MHNWKYFQSVFTYSMYAFNVTACLKPELVEGFFFYQNGYIAFCHNVKTQRA